MKTSPIHLAITALLAGLAGALTSLLISRPVPIVGTVPSQRSLHRAVAANTFEPAGISVPMPGDTLPSFTLTDLASNLRQFPEDFAGRLLLINVWASWCTPCISEMPELDRFARAQGEDGVQVLGIALDEPEAVIEFLGRIPVSYPIVVDPPGLADLGVHVGNSYGILPYTALVSADGRLIRQKIGPFMQGETDTWAKPDSIQ